MTLDGNGGSKEQRLQDDRHTQYRSESGKNHADEFDGQESKRAQIDWTLMWRPASVLQSNSSDDWDRFKFGEHSNNSANYSWYTVVQMNLANGLMRTSTRTPMHVVSR